jgi:hypothetical protein
MKKFPMKNSIVHLPEGDVDMFSFEDGVTFKEHEKELKDNLS